MKRTKLVLLILLTTLQSCNNDTCSDQVCFTPPESFRFEIVHKTSGENLFTNGTYNPGDITITNILNDRDPVEFTFISENNIDLIQIASIGWETEIVDLKVNISDHHIFNLYVDAERKMGACCNYTEYHEIAVKESEFEFNSQTGIYKILISPDAASETEILGVWNLISRESTKVIEETGATIVENGSDYNYAIEFTRNPNLILREGSYVLTSVYTSDGISSTERYQINASEEGFKDREWKIINGQLNVKYFNDGQPGSINVISEIVELTDKKLILKTNDSLESRERYTVNGETIFSYER